MAMLDMSDGEAGPVLFGIARFGGGDVQEVLIPFETPTDAERVAADKGWSNYEVCPLRFFVREARPPAEIRRLFDGELARAAERTRDLAVAGEVPAVEPAGEEPAAGEAGPPVGLVPWNVGEWAVVVRAGSNPADLYRALAGMPEGLAFLEPFGDVDIALVYGTPEAGTCGRGRAGARWRRWGRRGRFGDERGRTGCTSGGRG
jgi:uncharacterized repeat protein (TIGR03917 family)